MSYFRKFINNRKFISHSLGTKKGQRYGTNRFVVWQELTLFLENGTLLAIGCRRATEWTLWPGMAEQMEKQKGLTGSLQPHQPQWYGFNTKTLERHWTIKPFALLCLKMKIISSIRNQSFATACFIFLLTYATTFCIQLIFHRIFLTCHESVNVQKFFLILFNTVFLASKTMPNT